MQQNNELTISRIFNAPRELVFSVWTETDHLAQWWGPKGFKMNVARLDFKPGGTFHYSMQAPNGAEMWGKFVYREIVAPERIVFVNCFSDKDGNITRNPFMKTWPLEVLNTLTFTEQDEKTTLTFKAYPVNANEEETMVFGESHSMMQQGFAGTFEQLDEYLTAQKNIVSPQNL